MNKNTFAAVASAVAALTVVLSSDPGIGDALDDQTEDNRNAPSVVTVPDGGPIFVF